MQSQDRPPIDLTDHQSQRDLFGVVLFQPEELAAIYGVTPETMKTWVREKRIPGVRLGRRWYVTDTAIRKSIQAALQDAGLVRTPPKRKPRPGVVQPPMTNSPAMFDDMAIPSEGTDQ